MATRWGTGPVFAYEWLVGSRRWQGYAARAVFVAILLAGLGAVWQSQVVGKPINSIRAQASVGQKFAEAIVGIELSLVLLAAPAATAGAICLDKARGALTHLFVTDLSDAEIVLGKLAARLVPVLGLVLCTSPVMMFATLLGGADPDWLFGAFLASIGVGCLGCSLALMFSVWGSKTHEVLLASYLAIVGWLLTKPLWDSARWLVASPFGVADWFKHLNPFFLCFANVERPGSVGLVDYLIFLAACLALSSLFTLVAVLRVRVVAMRQAGGTQKSTRIASIFGKRRFVGLFPTLPGPTLDGNPVLWREWHRARPSRWSRLCWLIYGGVASAFGVLVLWQIFSAGAVGNPTAGTAAFTTGFATCVGLLLLTVGSATALSEERVRGSLNVVLATPLSTASIVWGKWLGTFRTVGFLCILPVAIVSAFAYHTGKVFAPIAMAVNIVAMGAAITSMGLALATWVPRLGRALGLAVTAYVVVTVGWLFLMISILDHGSGELWAMASPFFGPGNLTFHSGENQRSMEGVYAATIGWSIFFSFVAAVLFALTLATFNECLGRMDEAPDFDFNKPGRKGQARWEPELVME